MLFNFPYIIALDDTDAAGLIYGPNLLRICQRASEALLREIGYGLDVLFARRTMSMPFVHLEADFQQMLTVGRAVEVRVRIATLGKSSYRTEFEIFDGETRCATAATVQVCVDPRTRASMEIPADFRKALETYH